MAHVTENDYRKLADAIAEDLVQQQIPLNSSITKLAKSMDLNHEQVRRLCEATNNTTFNKLFQAKGKTASDRMIEFDIADPKKVLGEVIEEASCKTASVSELYELRPLNDEMHSVRHAEPDYGDLEKTAFELRPEAKASDEVDRRTMVKVLDNMRHQKLAADMEYLDKLGELRDRFRRLYDVQPFTEFEKEAVARYGEPAAEHLNGVRRLMGAPLVIHDIPAIQKTAGYVDDTTLEMQLLKQVIDTDDRRNAFARGIAKLAGML